MVSFKKINLAAFFLILFLASCFMFSINSLEADAAGIVPCGRNSGTAEEMQPCTLCHLFIGIHRIIDWGFKILTFVAIASLVLAGIMYMISAGNEKMMETAKNLIKHTLAGFAIVLGAWLIVNYSMILLSKKSDLGIGVVRWNEFNCDTSSDLGASGQMNGGETNSSSGSSSGGGAVTYTGECGTNNIGFCYDGVWYNRCPVNATFVGGGENCPSGEYCCFYPH